MAEFYKVWFGELIVGNSDVGNTSIWTRTHTYVPAIGGELRCNYLSSLHIFWKDVLGCEPQNLSLEEAQVINKKCVTAMFIHSDSALFSHLCEDLTFPEVRILCSAFLNPGTNVEVFLIPICNETINELCFPPPPTNLSPSLFIIFVTELEHHEAIEYITKLRENELGLRYRKGSFSESGYRPNRHLESYPNEDVVNAARNLNHNNYERAYSSEENSSSTSDDEYKRNKVTESTSCSCCCCCESFLGQQPKFKLDQPSTSNCYYKIQFICQGNHAPQTSRAINETIVHKGIQRFPVKEKSSFTSSKIRYRRGSYGKGGRIYPQSNAFAPIFQSSHNQQSDVNYLPSVNCGSSCDSFYSPSQVVSDCKTFDINSEARNSFGEKWMSLTVNRDFMGKTSASKSTNTVTDVGSEGSFYTAQEECFTEGRITTRLANFSEIPDNLKIQKNAKKKYYGVKNENKSKNNVHQTVGKPKKKISRFPMPLRASEISNKDRSKNERGKCRGNSTFKSKEATSSRKTFKSKFKVQPTYMATSLVCNFRRRSSNKIETSTKIRKPLIPKNRKRIDKKGASSLSLKLKSRGTRKDKGRELSQSRNDRASNPSQIHSSSLSKDRYEVKENIERVNEGSLINCEMGSHCSALIKENDLIDSIEKRASTHDSPVKGVVNSDFAVKQSAVDDSVLSDSMCFDMREKRPTTDGSSLHDPMHRDLGVKKSIADDSSLNDTLLSQLENRQTATDDTACFDLETWKSVTNDAMHFSLGVSQPAINESSVNGSVHLCLGTKRSTTDDSALNDATRLDFHPEPSNRNISLVTGALRYEFGTQESDAHNCVQDSVNFYFRSTSKVKDKSPINNSEVSSSESKQTVKGDASINAYVNSDHYVKKTADERRKIRSLREQKRAHRKKYYIVKDDSLESPPTRISEGMVRVKENLIMNNSAGLKKAFSHMEKEYLTFRKDKPELGYSERESSMDDFAVKKAIKYEFGVCQSVKDNFNNLDLETRESATADYPSTDSLKSTFVTQKNRIVSSESDNPGFNLGLQNGVEEEEKLFSREKKATFKDVRIVLEDLNHLPKSKLHEKFYNLVVVDRFKHFKEKKGKHRLDEPLLKPGHESTVSQNKCDKITKVILPNILHLSKCKLRETLKGIKIHRSFLKLLKKHNKCLAVSSPLRFRDGQQTTKSPFKADCEKGGSTNNSNLKMKRLQMSTKNPKRPKHKRERFKSNLTNIDRQSKQMPLGEKKYATSVRPSFTSTTKEVNRIDGGFAISNGSKLKATVEKKPKVQSLLRKSVKLSHSGRKSKNFKSKIVSHRKTCSHNQILKGSESSKHFKTDQEYLKKGNASKLRVEAHHSESVSVADLSEKNNKTFISEEDLKHDQKNSELVVSTSSKSEKLFGDEKDGVPQLIKSSNILRKVGALGEQTTTEELNKRIILMYGALNVGVQKTKLKSADELKPNPSIKKRTKSGETEFTLPPCVNPIIEEKSVVVDSFTLKRDTSYKINKDVFLNITQNLESWAKKEKVKTMCVGLSETQLQKLIEEERFKDCLHSPIYRFGILSESAGCHGNRVARIVLRKRCLLLLHHSVILDTLFGSLLRMLTKENEMKRPPYHFVLIPSLTLRLWLVLDKVDHRSNFKRVFTDNVALVERMLKDEYLLFQLSEKDEQFKSFGPWANINFLQTSLKALHKRFKYCHGEVALLLGAALNGFSSTTRFYKVLTIEHFLQKHNKG